MSDDSFRRLIEQGDVESVRSALALDMYELLKQYL